MTGTPVGSAPSLRTRSKQAPPSPSGRRPRKKVLLVFGSLERAGAQLRTLEVCRELRRHHAIDFDFCYIALGPNELAGEVGALGGSTHLVSIRSPRFPVEFSRLLREGRYDVVNSEPQLLSGIVAWLARRQRVPVRIVAIRNSIGDSGRLTASSPVVRRVLSSRFFVWGMRTLIKRNATHVIGVSRSALDSVFPPDWQSACDCRLIYNGIDLSRFRDPTDGRAVREEFGWPAHSRIVVNVGRFSAQKNHRTILAAMRHVHEEDPDVRLLLVGDGKLHHEIDRLVDQSGLREIVAMTGSREDVPRLLLASDVFFFPSLWEGLPGAALEALAAGLPIVASDIPPIREIAPFFSSSILMAPPDDAERHAAHIRVALQMPRDRTQTQEQFAATPFFLESAVEAYRSLYGIGERDGRVDEAVAEDREVVYSPPPPAMRSELGLKMNGTRSGRRPSVEVIGPAAAGKTSLVRALCSKDDRIRAGLDIGRTRFFGALVRKVGPFMPIWLVDYRHDRWLNRREWKAIVFLETWYRELEERESSDVLTTIFDHGPLFKLARLKEFGPEIARSKPFERWWLACRDRWMNTLDLVVWLDAPDAVLLQRVQKRGHGYLDANPSREDKHEFLARYRSAFSEILEQGSADRPRLLLFRSDQRSVDEIADEVLAALASEPSVAVRRERSL